MKVFFIASPSQTLQISRIFFAKLYFFSHFDGAHLQILRSRQGITSRPEQENSFSGAATPSSR
jgi:hypothetical protein